MISLREGVAASLGSSRDESTRVRCSGYLSASAMACISAAVPYLVPCLPTMVEAEAPRFSLDANAPWHDEHLA